MVAASPNTAIQQRCTPRQHHCQYYQQAWRQHKPATKLAKAITLCHNHPAITTPDCTRPREKATIDGTNRSRKRTSPNWQPLSGQHHLGSSDTTNWLMRSRSKSTANTTSSRSPRLTNTTCCALTGLPTTTSKLSLWSAQGKPWKPQEIPIPVPRSSDSMRKPSKLKISASRHLVTKHNVPGRSHQHSSRRLTSQSWTHHNPNRSPAGIQAAILRKRQCPKKIDGHRHLVHRWIHHYNSLRRQMDQTMGWAQRTIWTSGWIHLTRSKTGTTTPQAQRNSWDLFERRRRGSDQKTHAMVPTWQRHFHQPLPPKLPSRSEAPKPSLTLLKGRSQQPQHSMRPRPTKQTNACDRYRGPRQLGVWRASTSPHYPRMAQHQGHQQIQEKPHQHWMAHLGQAPPNQASQESWHYVDPGVVDIHLVQAPAKQRPQVWQQNIRGPARMCQPPLQMETRPAQASRNTVRCHHGQWKSPTAWTGPKFHSWCEATQGLLTLTPTKT